MYERGLKILDPSIWCSKNALWGLSETRILNRKKVKNADATKDGGILIILLILWKYTNRSILKRWVSSQKKIFLNWTNFQRIINKTLVIRSAIWILDINKLTGFIAEIESPIAIEKSENNRNLRNE